MVVAPAVAHREIAEKCAPHLMDGQVVFLHPGATFGALEFRKVLDDEGCNAEVVIAEANSLLYSCRSPKPGHASIFGIKKGVMVATLPANKNENVVKVLNTAFQQIYAGKNIMETSLSNPNAMMHPAPTLLNTSLIESGRDWLYYWDGITPSIGSLVEKMDKERLALARAFGLNLLSIREWYASTYDTYGATLTEVVRNNKAYECIQGQKTLHTRYILEDIPMGLLPMVSLGKKIGIKVTNMDTVAKLGELLIGEDLFERGRTLKNLGLDEMSIQDIQQFVEKGIRK